MNYHILQSKYAQLPEHLKAEVVDFIEFLLKKKASNEVLAKPKFGSAKGLIEMKPDFDAPLDDFKEYMS